MDTSLLLQDIPIPPAYLWLLAGVVFMGLEALGMQGVGLVFGGIAAFIVGVCIEANIINEPDLVTQLSSWFFITILIAAVLYKPLQKWRVNPNAKDSFDNIVGTTAKVAAGGLMLGKPGRVYWSGTQMNAQIDDSSGKEAFLEDDIVTVVAIRGNQLLVSDTSPETS